jgi:FkbM family methyltransferase
VGLGIANPVAFDIGANGGKWSKAFISNSPDAVSYAFEPSVATYKQLTNNILGVANIFPCNVGMSDKEGIAKLFTDSAGSGLASLSSRRLDHFNISMEHFEEVSLTTVDTFIKTHDVLPSIIKLDVEGHELSVLLGAIDSISKIPVIQFEFGGCNLDTHTTFQDFWYFFFERNFAIYRLGPKGISLVKNYSEMYEIYITTNYFAINKNYRPDNFA